MKKMMFILAGALLLNQSAFANGVYESFQVFSKSLIEAYAKKDLTAFSALYLKPGDIDKVIKAGDLDAEEKENIKEAKEDLTKDIQGFFEKSIGEGKSDELDKSKIVFLNAMVDLDEESIKSWGFKELSVKIYFESVNKTQYVLELDDVYFIDGIGWRLSLATDIKYAEISSLGEPGEVFVSNQFLPADIKNILQSAIDNKSTVPGLSAELQKNYSASVIKMKAAIEEKKLSLTAANQVMYLEEVDIVTKNGEKSYYLNIYAVYENEKSLVQFDFQLPFDVAKKTAVNDFLFETKGISLSFAK